MPLCLFHSLQCIRQLHAGIAENNVEIARRKSFRCQIKKHKRILAPGKRTNKCKSLLSIFFMLFLNEANRLLFKIRHQRTIHFIEPVDIHRLELQPFFRQTFDRRLRIEATALRFGYRFAVQNIPTHAFCPEQGSIRIFWIIPISIHAEKIQFLMENWTNFLLDLCTNRQPINAVFICPFISVQTCTVSSSH